MSGLVDGSTAPWDFVAKQLHREELKKATSGIVAASRPTPPPRRAEPCVIWVHQTVPAPVIHEQVHEQTRLIARFGVAARDLGHAIADNLRRLNSQEDLTP